MYQKCAACDGKLIETQIDSALDWAAEVPRKVAVQECQNCGGIHFTGYLGDSFKVVAHQSLLAGEPEGEQTYFDLSTIGSAGQRRIHGWMDENRMMVQEG